MDEAFRPFPRAVWQKLVHLELHSLHKRPTHSRSVVALIPQAFSPSVFYIKGLDAVMRVVLECWVANRHALLTPLQSSFIDGFHWVSGPAGQVSVQWTADVDVRVIASLSCTGSAADSRYTKWWETHISWHVYIPVKLGLGPLWDMALWKFGFVVRQQTFNTEKDKSHAYVLNSETASHEWSSSK